MVCLVHKVWERLASSGLTRNRYHLHPSDGRRENMGNPVHMMSSLGLQRGLCGGGDYSTHRVGGNLEVPPHRSAGWEM